MQQLTPADLDKVRDIAGFPKGTDDDIIALSKPPNYTACPNPFVEEFIREHGTPYDEFTTYDFMGKYGYWFDANGYPVLNAEGEAIGEVTTGYHTISSDRSVCMALVDSNFAKLGTPLQVQIRKKVFSGTVVKKKFYEKHYKK